MNACFQPHAPSLRSPTHRTHAAAARAFEDVPGQQRHKGQAHFLPSARCPMAILAAPLSVVLQTTTSYPRVLHHTACVLDGRHCAVQSCRSERAEPCQYARIAQRAQAPRVHMRLTDKAAQLAKQRAQWPQHYIRALNKHFSQLCRGIVRHPGVTFRVKPKDTASKACGACSPLSPTDAAHALDFGAVVVAVALVAGGVAASGVAESRAAVVVVAVAQRVGPGRSAQWRRDQCRNALPPARRHGRRRRQRFFRLYRRVYRHGAALAQPAGAVAGAPFPAPAWRRCGVRCVRGDAVGEHGGQPAVSRWQAAVLPVAPGRLRHRGAGIPGAAAAAAKAQEHRLDLWRKPGAHLLRRSDVSRLDAQSAPARHRSSGRAQPHLHRRQRLDHCRHGRLNVRRAADHCPRR